MRIAVAVALSMFIGVGTVMAVELITYPNRVGTVVFPHKKHQEALGQCRGCHEQGPGKIDDFGKVMAHGKGCRGCHETMKRGPTVCAGCHVAG